MSALVEIDGGRLEVLTLGDPSDGVGPAPVVFLHEGLGSVSQWRDWPERLGQGSGRAALVYSRRGYGRSDPVPDVRGPARTEGGQRVGRLEPDYMHHEAWRVLPALLAAMGVRRPPVLLGHSDGATIALLYASRYPTEAVIAMAPHVMVEPITLASIARARDAWLHGDLRQRLARHHADVDGAFWQWNDIWLDPRFARFDIRSECRNIDCPVLALQGLDDVYGSLRQILHMAPERATVWRHTLAACGHSPQRDQPQATLAICRDFLATVG